MAKRKKMSKSKSRRNFTGGTGTHPKNNRGNPMRGGIRL